jgi:hypothetical protein
MASNYPPGVTGREYQIAGADLETEESRTCSACGLTEVVIVEWYDYSKWFTCEGCGAENDLSSEIPEPTDIEDPTWGEE